MGDQYQLREREVGETDRPAERVRSEMQVGFPGPPLAVAAMTHTMYSVHTSSCSSTTDSLDETWTIVRLANPFPDGTTHLLGVNSFIPLMVGALVELYVTL